MWVFLVSLSVDFQINHLVYQLEPLIWKRGDSKRLKSEMDVLLTVVVKLRDTFSTMTCFTVNYKK